MTHRFQVPARLAARPVSILAGLLAAVLLPALAQAHVLDAINAARASGCSGKPGTASPLTASPKLNAAARRLSKGDSLENALSSSGYRALQSSSMALTNAKTDADVARTLAKQVCNDLRDPAVTEIGIERRGNRIWVVLARPFAAPTLTNPATVARRVLALANEARSRPRRCGRTSFEAVPPLTLDDRLNRAALVQARDLAKRQVLDHRGGDGSTPSGRVSRQGYAWRIVGENVASGPTSAEEVMAGWLASPGHCENLMSPRFTQMGVGFVIDDRTKAGVYWAQVFATPKP